MKVKRLSLPFGFSASVLMLCLSTSVFAQTLPSAEDLLKGVTQEETVQKEKTPKKETQKDDKKESTQGLPPSKLNVPDVPEDAKPAEKVSEKKIEPTDKSTKKVDAQAAVKTSTVKVKTEHTEKKNPVTAPKVPPFAVETSKSKPPSISPLQLVHSVFERLHEADKSKYVDLTPWLDSEKWWQAHALLAQKKCSSALKVARVAVNEKYPLDKKARASTRPPEVQYALARFELCGGHASSGRKTMMALTKRNDGVGLLARRALGQSVPTLKDNTASTKSTNQTPSLATRAREFERLCARNKHDVAHVTGVFDALRGERLRSSTWYRVTNAMIGYLERRKETEEAGRLLLGVYERTRGWRSAKGMAKKLSQFERRHKQTLRTLDVRMDDVRHLIVEKSYRKAHQLHKQNARLARVKSKEAKGWRLYVKGLELERRRKRDEAVKVFESAEKLIKHPKARARLYYGWARALRRVNKDMEAVALYKRLCNEYPAEQTLCAESLYQSGRLLQYENKLKEAYDAFFMLAGFYPESKRLPEAIWRAALCAYLTKNYKGARPLLETVATNWPNIRDSSGLPIGLKVQYWQGVVAMKLGEKARAFEHLNKTVKMGPLTWYGRLAHVRIKELGHHVPEALPMSKITLQDLNILDGLRIKKDGRLKMAAPLIRAGFYPDAYGEVRRYAYRTGLVGGLEILAALKLAMGEPDKAHWMARRLIRTSGPTAHSLRTWATSFPLVHIEHIHKYAQAYSVSPMLVQAIMRQESGFRATVKSYAGALGLMQLMPGTAKYVARVFLDDHAYRRKHIFKPETNIKLGSMYIRLHVAFASDRVPLALAGYNAGPAPLRRWLKDYGDRELDAWVESITFKQARGYVRKVMTSYIAYSALYNPEQMPKLSMKLPSELRKWGVIPGKSVETVSRLDLMDAPVDLMDD